MGKIVLWATYMFAIWAIRRDTARREGISAAIWVPTLWLGILASRPFSTWLGAAPNPNADFSLEGSPIDASFYMVMIFAASIIVSKRKPNWPAFFSRNWPILLFYFYLLITVLWAADSLISFKRWFKEVGNIMVALVILTEKNPQHAFRAVFVRCAYLLIPLSYVYIRYFPELGRVYNLHSGEMQATGVTFQKNSLGATILVTGLVLVWDLLEKRQPMRKQPMGKKGDRLGLFLRLGVLILGVYLLRVCDSKTSLLCLMIGGSILVATKVPGLKGTVRNLGLWMPGLILLLYQADALFGLKESALRSLGRDTTFTGRTGIWHELMILKTDPLIGTGFCSFWSDRHYRAILPDWVPSSAHNGYFEIYIDGGFIGVALLFLLICVTAIRISKEMRSGALYAIMRYAALMAVIIANFSESNFARMAPVGFLFILIAVEMPRRKIVNFEGKNRSPEPQRQIECADFPPLSLGVEL
jgi:exopolysaccharide production protein ExoQ